MTSLQTNLVRRIDRLPKPKDVTGAMQPLFEAVSNAIHSTQSRFQEEVGKHGKVTVKIDISPGGNKTKIEVRDNGVGLDEKNWEAFKTTDTDNKIKDGGKGIGRLTWFDCFDSISVSSRSVDINGVMTERSFIFRLAREDQLKDNKEKKLDGKFDTFFLVRFEGLRNNGYQKFFPNRDEYAFRHFTSHFLPIFIGGRSPEIKVSIGDETRMYPATANDLISREETSKIVETEEYGDFKVVLLECHKDASSDLKGKHYVHFIAHDRTVHSHCIDNMLGLGYFGEDKDRVVHALVTGKYLDTNVNQERTGFNFEDAKIDKIIKDVLSEEIEIFLAEPLKALRSRQRLIIERITATYPSVAFGGTDEQQKKVPKGELNEDALYGALARERFRRDKKQAKTIRDSLTSLKGGKVDIEGFNLKIKEASEAIGTMQQRSLAEYIVRRKAILDFIEVLLEKVRDDAQDSSYQHERVLHSFICPLRVSTIGKLEPTASHDLWIIDERLTFAQYFSSDVPFKTMSKDMESLERPDVLIFDYVHGLRQDGDPSPSTVLLIEFKRPGREDYKDDENPQVQVENYVKKLQSGKLKDVNGRPIQLDENTIFYCYIVADIVGKMNDWTYSWRRTPDGRGRTYVPQGGFRGFVDLLGWDQLIGDAKARNKAFFTKAGIPGDNLFNSADPSL